MQNHRQAFALLIAGLVIAPGLSASDSPAVSPVDPATSAEEQYYGDVVRIVLAGRVHNTTLTITGPADYYAWAYAEEGIPTVQLSELGTVADGIYIWQITAATDELIEVRDDGSRGAPSSRSTERGVSSGDLRRGTVTINKGTAESGSFRVQNGVILPKSNSVEEEPVPVREN